VRQVFRSIMDAIDGMLAFLGRAVAKIPARFRPALLDQVVAAGDDAGARIADRERTARAPGPFVAAAAGAVPAAVEAGTRARSEGSFLQALAAQMATAQRQAEQATQRPIHVHLDVDGDTLAAATVRAEREDAVRRFGAIPSR
ncbi:hypothetical protein, partial [Haliangium sp.]|uniref:hypothetical protein n=1 Tax=Haliangium sp. TaxID=2663208 RepID=UPI003D1195B6